MVLPRSVLLLREPEKHELVTLLVENVLDYAIFTLDVEGHVTTWNPGAERMKGYSSDEILGKHFSIFYPPEDVTRGKPAAELEQAARSGRFEDEGWRVRKDGSRFWANVVVTALRDQEGILRGFGKVTRDLSTRRESEQTARQLAAAESARAVAEKSERFERNLLAVVGHDLRNCLSVVLTTGEMVRLHADEPEKVRHRAAQIVNTSRRMAQIIRTIIDYTHAQRGEGIPIDPKDGADLHHVCDRILQEFRVLHPTRRTVYEGEGCAVGVWDEGRLEQVVQNLLGNAVKFSPPESSISLRWSRERADHHDDGDLVLAVHNEGNPIAADLLPHIFEPFRSGRTNRSGESMGLGLFIVREIVRAHGGSVDVRSDAAHGTTFTIRIPPRPPKRPS